MSSDFEIKPIDRFEEKNVNPIWEKFSANINFSIHRDANYLNWRIFDKPNFDYITKGLFFNSNLVAFVAYNIVRKHGGRIGYMLEFMYLPEYAEEANSLLIFANNAFIKQDVDVVLVWNFSHSPNHKYFKRNGYVRLPELIKPIKLHFGVRFFQSTYHLKEQDWYLSYCDSDTV